MRTAVTAFVLCLFAATAGATPAPEKTPAAVAVTRAAATQAPAASQPVHEQVKTAGAITHDGAPSTRARVSQSQAGDDDEQNQHTSAGMLLAAVALMLGIAWRRFSAHEQ